MSCTQKVFTVFKTICLHLQTTQFCPVFMTHHPTFSYNFPSLHVGLTFLAQKKAYGKYSLTSCHINVVFAWSQAKECSYRSQTTSLILQEGLWGTLFLSNVSRNSHSKTSQKCTYSPPLVMLLGDLTFRESAWILGIPGQEHLEGHCDFYYLL
jgi:hypothetical protein